MGVITNIKGVSPTVYYGRPAVKPNDRELSRLITAAVINRGFRQMLLDNPKQAMELGYKGETFALDMEEQDLISSIQAGTLAEFASKLVKQTRWKD